MTTLTKNQALKMLGGTVAKAAKKLGVTRQAVSQWPDPLTDKIAARVYFATMKRRKQNVEN